jgi:hypothetical protein
VRQRSRQHGVPSAANFSLAARSGEGSGESRGNNFHPISPPSTCLVLCSALCISQQVTSDERSSATRSNWRDTLLSRSPASFGRSPVLQSGLSVHSSRVLHRFVSALSRQRCRASTFGTAKVSGIIEFSLPPAPQARMHLRFQGPRTPPFKTWQKRLGLVSVEDHSVLNSEPHGRNPTSGLSALVEESVMGETLSPMGLCHMELIT